MSELGASSDGIHPAGEAFFRKLFEASVDAMLVADPDSGRILECNPAAEQLFGRTREELIGQPTTIIHPPEQAERHRQGFKKHIQNGGGYEVEVEILTPAGDTRWASVRSAMLELDAGQAAVGIFRDITEGKVLREALQRSEDRLALATRGTGIGIWDYDVAADRLEWDSRMFSLFDVLPEDFGHRFSDWEACVVPEALPKALAEFEAALRGERDFYTEFPVRIAGGRVRYLAGAATVVRNEAGDPIRVVGVNYDISERKRTEEALRRSEEKFRTYVEAAPEGIFIIDEGGRYIDVNEAACRMSGYLRHELLSMTIAGLASPDAGIDPYATLENLKSEGALEVEMPLRRKDGTDLPVSLRAVALGEGRYMGFCSDLTEYKQMQQSLIDAERMSAVGVLTAGIAHEFNNAMTGVMGYLDLLTRRRDLPDDVLNQVRLAIHGADRVANLTRSLMAFTDHASAYEAVFSLEKTIEETLAYIRPDLQARDIEIHVRSADTPMVRGVQSEIGQVILNLLTNASHALIEEPEKRITITSAAEGDEAVVRVADTGMGVPPEDLGSIFLPFFTRKGEKAAPDSPLQRVRGTGLGLSLSRHIVERHGGRIEVESEPGAGSAFTVRLPKAEPVGEEPDEDPVPVSLRDAAEPSLTDRRVLVLDDDPDVRDLLRILLERYQARVETCDDGAEALVGLRDRGHDLVFVDLLMPGMSGEEFIRRTRDLPESVRPQIVVITGWSQGDRHEEVRQLGVRHVLDKPLDIDKVLSLVHDIIGS